VKVRARWFLIATALLAVGGSAVARMGEPRFDHWQHRKLFPSCQGCHAGATRDSGSIWPSAEQCATCHDGTIEKRVDWRPPETRTPSNLKFTHAEHGGRVRRNELSDSSFNCVSCHEEKAAPWMQIKRTISQRCLDCHGVAGPHFAAADTACATCHLTLAQASTLSREAIKTFPKPESHDQPDFGMAGHGRLAKGVGGNFTVAASCATCHARDFCITCHVDAPENRSIQALEPDQRSLVIPAKLAAPASHQRADFLSIHGREAGNNARECRTCHTSESCTVCHSTSAPAQVRRLASAGPGRGAGALVTRTRPVWHGSDFATNHKALASANPRSCVACHARSECLDCHRPNAAEAGDFHPAGFLTRHPAAAYARETSCADCHSTTQFCAACHQQSGLVSRGTLKPGFHDAKRFFFLGHGQAARQSLETCVGCHAERDCLTCHAAQGGRHFNPHGPGFDATRLKKKNPEMCTACHGESIP
jgi:hypothetical protein